MLCDTVNKAVNDQKKNIVLMIFLTQLRTGYCRFLGSYESRINKDAGLNICADCGKIPHDVKHLFACLV